MRKDALLFLFVVLIAVTSILLNLPEIHLKFAKGPIKIDREIGGSELDLEFLSFRLRRDLKIKKGLDLEGGVHIILKADMGNVSEEDRRDALESARDIIERRVNFFGVSEPNIQTSKVGKDYRVLVELPGVTEVTEALELIGKTAQLDFREQDEATGAAEPFKKTELTGAHLKKAQPQFNSQTGEVVIGLKFTKEGAELFEEITKRNLDKPLAIFIDERLVTAPRVQSVITGGEAVITGQFTVEEAKRLAIQFNSGALPVPVEVQEQRNIGPTLGQDSVKRSLTAGLIGLFLVGFFMMAYYRRLGLLAVSALIIYALLTLALYKLIPITLTLAGMAGFILSIGMAVDANILIFERIREEKRLEKPQKAAIELGFGRAWDSIRDANLNTLLICFILFNPFNWSFLNTSGMVRGFALTLGLGIFISLFTGIVVTRTLIRVFYK